MEANNYRLYHCFALAHVSYLEHKKRMTLVWKKAGVICLWSIKANVSVCLFEWGSAEDEENRVQLYPCAIRSLNSTSEI